MKDGIQVVYVPDHAFEGGVPKFSHPDCEFGFTYRNPPPESRETIFVRYFAKFRYPINETDELPDLRTKANSEATPVANLFYRKSVPQDYVDEWCDTLDHERESGL